MIHPVNFSNKGENLSGILEIPENGDGDIGVVFLHGWGTYRIGPHRIFVDAARSFAELGIPSLRFDFRGRGESEGDAERTTLLDMIDDVPAAIEVLLGKTQAKRVVLLGLCSGGEVAVGSAMCHPSIVGIILWSTPLLARQMNTDVSTDARKTVHHAKSYLHKLFSGETWRKVFKLQVNYAVIFRILFGHHFAEKKKQMKEGDLLELFKGCRGDLLFVYGGNDPETPAAEAAYRDICEKNNLSAVFKTIPEANHNFYSLDWKRSVIDFSRDFLNGVSSSNLTT